MYAIAAPRVRDEVTEAIDKKTYILLFLSFWFNTVDWLVFLCY